MNTRATIFFCTRHIIPTSSIESCSLMKIFLTVFKIECMVALTIKGRKHRKYKGESCHSCKQHIVKTCLS